MECVRLCDKSSSVHPLRETIAGGDLKNTLPGYTQVHHRSHQPIKKKPHFYIGSQGFNGRCGKSKLKTQRNRYGLFQGLPQESLKPSVYRWNPSRYVNREPFWLRGVTAEKYRTHSGIQGKNILGWHRTSYGTIRGEDKGKKGVDLVNLRSNEHWKIEGWRGTNVLSHANSLQVSKLVCTGSVLSVLFSY